MPSVLFNENDRFAAAWLRELWPDATVDSRSIVDVEPVDLAGFRRVHLFAGIGGWEHALALAGWPAGRPVWTGSCPCQPFSIAGKGKGKADARHLWPEMRRLVAECRPPAVLGEQVASPAGRAWLAGVRADLEDLGYAVGAADLCAAGVAAPHIRQRLYWVAEPGPFPPRQHRPGEDPGPDGPEGEGEAADEPGRRRPAFWDAFDLLPCLDGKARRVEPGTFPLAHGVPARVGRLRGYGNAIVPPLAAEFLRAFLEAEGMKGVEHEHDPSAA